MECHVLISAFDFQLSSSEDRKRAMMIELYDEIELQLLQLSTTLRHSREEGTLSATGGLFSAAEQLYLVAR